MIRASAVHVLIRKEGDSLILTPIRRHTLRDLLASWAALEGALR
jgi:antitoxin VapB